MGLINKGRKTYKAYKEGKAVYDAGRQIYDDYQTYKDNSGVYRGSDDLQDVANREANPRSASAKMRRGKLADALEEKAQQLQDLEDNPIMYTGKDGEQKESKMNAWKKRGILIGGGAGVGLVGGLGVFSTTLGPAQLIHMSEILKDYHLGPQEDDNDQSTFRLMKYAYYFSKGQAEKSRLSFLGNKLANRYEIYLNSVGMTSKYTRAGFFDGLAIDRSFPAYRGLNDQQLIKLLGEEGIVAKKGSEIKNSRIPPNTIVATTEGMTKRESRKFLSLKMRQGGASRWSAYVAARALNQRNGAINKLLHPIKALDAKALRSSEKVIVDFKNRLIQRVKNKSGTITSSVTEGDKDKPPSEQDKANANEVDKGIQETASEAADTEKKALAGDTKATSSFADSLTAKRLSLGAGAMGLLSLPCILKAIDGEYVARKHQFQVIPLMNNAAQRLSVGEQAEAGVDVTAEQLAPWADQLVGTDKDGKQNSAFDADAITAITGDTIKNKPPKDTLTGVMEPSPFDIVNHEPVKSALAAVCSAEFQGLNLVIGVITGPFSTLASVVISHFAEPAIVEKAAEWGSNTPFNPFDTGADQGNDTAYGMQLLKNNICASKGCSVLSNADAQKNQNDAQAARLDEFRSKSLAYRLFDTKDYHTPMAKFIDSQAGGGILTNFGKAFAGLTNMGGTFGSTLLGALSGRTYAAQRFYDYSGIPTLGFSSKLMNNQVYENPYLVGRQAVTLLEGDNGQKWIDQAKLCKGVTVAKGSDGLWDATSQQDSTPTVEDMTKPECREGSSPEWDLLSMYINYQNNINSSACVMIDDVQSCQASGWQGGGASSAGDASGGLPTGDAKSLAQQLMALYPKQVNFQGVINGTNVKNAFQHIIDNNGVQKACGKDVPIDPDLLALMLKATQAGYSIYIGLLAEGHDCDTGQHPLGKAMDINGVAKDGVTTGGFLHFNSLNAQQMQMVSGFYDFLGANMPKDKGRLLQLQCFPTPPPQHPPTVYKALDSCDHLHVDMQAH